MNRNPRNQLLLSGISATNPFKSTLAPRLCEIGTAYDRDIEAIASDGRLSQQGKGEKAQARRQDALRALDAAQKPINDHVNESKSLHSGMKIPTYDKADIVAALNRRELRDRALAMNLGQKTMRMSGPRRDKAFVDAVLEFEPWISGFDLDNPNERELYEGAKAERLRDLNGDLMTALEARAITESEIMMIANVIRNDVAGDGTDLGRAAA